MDRQSARERQTKEASLRVLVIDRAPPTVLSQGNSLIGVHLFRRLGQRHHLTLVAPIVGPESSELGVSLREAFAETRLVPLKRPVPALSGWLSLAAAETFPGIPANRALTGLVAALRDLLADRTFDVVHVRQLPMSALSPLIIPRPRLLELVDSETLASERAQGRGPRGITRRFAAGLIERRAVEAFDVTTTVALADAERIRSLVPAASVAVVPNGVDVDYFRPGTIGETAGRLVFHGAMSFAPNIAAVIWFCETVLPLVQRRRPDAHLVIVGRDPAKEVRALSGRSGVEVTGTVDDVRPYLSTAQVCVVPMLGGSGIKNKLLEAMAMGRAIVATPLGAEALPEHDRAGIVVAASGDEIAAQVLRLLGDTEERSRLGRAARRTVQECYSWDTTAERYDELYQTLAGKRRVTRHT